MSFLNDSHNSSLFVMDAFNRTDPDSNGSRPDVPLSLQWTRFAVQTVSTPIVVFVGLIGNMLNILVLLQPSMRSSTNVYILVLSLADSVYLVFNFVLSLLDCRKRGLSDAAYYFNPYGRFLSNFSGNVAVWVTVSFTVERYIAVCHPMRGKIWCTVRRAKLASFAVSFLVLMNTLPTIFELDVVDSATGLRCVPSQLADDMFYSWWYVTVFTFIPLVCLALFNIFLIKTLLVASKNRQKLVMSQSGSPATNTKFYQARPLQNGSKDSKNIRKKKLKLSNANSGNIGDDEASQSLRSNSPTDVYICDTDSCSQGTQQPIHPNYQSKTGNSDSRRPSAISYQLKSSTCAEYVHKRQNKRMSREQNKVTLLLVTIVMIFLLCQLPWTALFLYTTYLNNNRLTGNRTHIKIAGNICNLLGLINSSVNFYLYSCFSRRFRQTLAALVLFWRRKSNSVPAIL